MIRRNYIIWEPFLLSLMVVLGMLVGYKMRPASKAPSNSEEFTSMEEVLRYIESKYVDPVDRSTLQEAAILGMLSKLDPHTKYISPKDIQAIKEDMEGAYLGVGIKWLTGLDSMIYVVRVSKDSPAAKAGIKKGDQLIKFDSLDYRKEKYSLAYLDSVIRNQGAGDLTFTLERRGEGSRNFSLAQTMVSLPSIDCAIMLNDSIGLIRINRFSSKTYQEFMQAWEDLSGKGMTDMIIDIRGNPGGYLQETVKILSQFIQEKNELLVYTEGRNEKRKDYTSNGRIFHPIDDVVVLIDENSASASEILAGTFQDLDRALVMGRRTFGKGLVQEQYDLMGGGAIRMTTARYYTPSGRSIQREYDTTSLYHADLYVREQNGELTHEEASLIADSTQHFTKSGRLVYGRGGVTPDVFIPRGDPFGIHDESEVEYFIVQCALQWMWSPQFDDISADTGSLKSEGQFQVWKAFLDSTFQYHEMGHFTDEVSEMDHVMDHFEEQVNHLVFDDEINYYISVYEHDAAVEQALEVIKRNQVDTYLGVSQTTRE